MRTLSIYGHAAQCRVLVSRYRGSTLDVEVIACDTCPGLVGRCFRVSGLPMTEEAAC